MGSGKNELKTFKGHNASILQIFEHKGKLVSGSSNGVIKVWDIEGGNELQTLEGPRGAFYSMGVYQDQLISTSPYGKMRAWDIESGKESQPHKDFEGCKENHFSLKNGKVYYWKGRTIHILDLESKKEQEIGCDLRVNFYLAYEHKFFTCAGKCINVIDANSNKLLAVFDNVYEVKSFSVHSGKLYALLGEQTICIWDLKSCTKLRTLYYNTAPIDRILSCEDKLFICSESRIEIMDFSFPSLSPYERSTLEVTLSILRKMAEEIDLKNRGDLEKISSALHPDFQQRLKQQAFNCSRSFLLSKEAISRVEMQVCIYLMLDRIHAEDDSAVLLLIEQLKRIDHQQDKLEELCRKIFLNDPKGLLSPRDSILQKEEAVLEFKQTLKELWGEDSPIY